jgi:hypothetical protein
MTDTAVLFSGGRDSTLLAYRLYCRGNYLHLLSASSGLGHGDALRELRVTELRALWGADAFRYVTIPTSGLVRHICFRDLVADIQLDGRQLLLLGEALALVTVGIRYCLLRDVANLAFGATRYEAHFAEQTPTAINAFGALCAEYGIAFEAPLTEIASESIVKEELFLAGISPKSLESSTLLADLDDSPPEDIVAGYLSRKIPWVRKYLSDILTAKGGGPA